MKNVFTKSLIAASVFSAFAATAGTVDVANGATLFAHDTDTTTLGALTNSILVSKELLDNSADADEKEINRTLTSTDYGARVINYSSPVDLKAKSTLIFKFVGGAVGANTTMALLRDVGGNFEVAGTVTDFVADADGNYTSVKFQLNDGITGDQVDADEVLVVGDSSDATDPAVLANLTQPSFIVADGSSSLTVSVPEVRDDNAQLLNAPTAGSETVATVTAQYELTVTKNTDKIDVDLQRLGFTAATAGDDADTTTSFGVLGLDLTNANFTGVANKDYPAANFTYTIAGTQEAITDIDGVAALTYDEDDNEWTSAVDALADLLAADESVTGTVDGETEIEEASYPVTLTVAATTAGGTYGDTKAFAMTTDTTLLDWKLNAATAMIPYMPYGTATTPSNISQVIYLTNKGTAEGRIFVDVWAQDGEKVLSNVQLTGMTVPNGITQLGSQLKTLLDAEGVENEKVTIKVVAEIPQTDLEVYSSYNVGGSDRGFVINDSNVTSDRP